MAISSLGTNGYTDINRLALSSPSKTSATTNPNFAEVKSTSQSEPAQPSATGNNSNLSAAVRQAVAQIQAGGDLSRFLSADSQQSASNFTRNLFGALPGFSSSSANPLSGLPGSPSDQASEPVKLDQSSATITLQTSIQKLITQLDGSQSGADSNAFSGSGIPNLQESFNNLLTASGGNPNQTSLQSFLKSVAVNIQASTSIGSLFDASA